MIILGMMQVSKKIPFDDPQVLLSIRGIYILSNMVIAAVYLVLQSRINSRKGNASNILLDCLCEGHSFLQALCIIEPTQLIKPTRSLFRSNNPEIRRTCAYGLRRRAQVDHHNCPFLRFATTPRVMEIATDGHRHDVCNAHILQIHQPASDSEHHPIERCL